MTHKNNLILFAGIGLALLLMRKKGGNGGGNTPSRPAPLGSGVGAGVASNGGVLRPPANLTSRSTPGGLRNPATFNSVAAGGLFTPQRGLQP